MSDGEHFVHQSKVLWGPLLVKMATGEDSDDETLGGAKCMLKFQVSQITWRKMKLRRCGCVARYQVFELSKLGPALPMPNDPPYTPGELLGLMP